MKHIVPLFLVVALPGCESHREPPPIADAPTDELATGPGQAAVICDATTDTGDSEESAPAPQESVHPAATASATHGSKTPPPGPPWQREFVAAQREALETGKPVFIYFTKTY